jgi:hypothetical protein
MHKHARIAGTLPHRTALAADAIATDGTFTDARYRDRQTEYVDQTDADGQTDSTYRDSDGQTDKHGRQHATHRTVVLSGTHDAFQHAQTAQVSHCASIALRDPDRRRISTQHAQHGIKTDSIAIGIAFIGAAKQSDRQIESNKDVYRIAHARIASYCDR